MKKIHTQGSNFLNDKNETVILSGINMVCKDRSVNHIGDYTDKDFEYLKGLGMNVIRLGIFWESVEPSPGVYDDEYLAGIEAIVNKASKYEIFVYLDMHQDLYGAKFEDGAPDWAVLDEGTEHIRTDLWSESYLLSPAVQRAFDNFWRNEASADGVGIMDHFIKAWVHVASYFSSNKYVIGYDLFNEPFPGSAAGEILPIIGEVMAKLEGGVATEQDLFETIGAIEVISGKFEEENLNPFYEKIVPEIRKADPDCLIFLETNYFSNAAVPTHIRPVSVNGTVLPNQVFAPHGYDIFVDTDKYNETDNSRVDLIFATHAGIAKVLNLPMLVGEWGCYPNANDVQIEQAAHIKAMFKAVGVSDTYFDFSHIYGNRIVDAIRR